MGQMPACRPFSICWKPVELKPIAGLSEMLSREILDRTVIDPGDNSYQILPE